eukprot:9550750-Karenia_brevis.AAC.1
MAALEASLDWVPMILGDGQKVGSFVQKYDCEKGRMRNRFGCVQSPEAFSQPAVVLLCRHEDRASTIRHPHCQGCCTPSQGSRYHTFFKNVDEFWQEACFLQYQATVHRR